MGTQETFIMQIAPLIQKYAKLYGYKVASPIIAQACLESRYGQSGLAKYHNYFGMKAGKNYSGPSVKMKTKEEYQKGVLTEIYANFRTYPDMDAGVKGYFDFISTKRYANLKTATTAEQYLTFIKLDGYATSNSYVKSCMNVVNKYNLKMYDTGVVPAASLSPYQIGQTYTLQSDMYVRQTPNGSKIKYDSLTEDGKKNGKFDDDGNAILNKGTRVTCKAMSENWMKIPSGWVCAYNSTKTYIK